VAHNRTRQEARILRADRVRKKIGGTAERPRLCVFISNKQVYAQVIDDAAGSTLAAASTQSPSIKEEAKGKNMTEMAKLVGKSVAQAAMEKGVTTVVFDKSGYKYGKRLGALADAAREAGLKF